MNFMNHAFANVAILASVLEQLALTISSMTLEGSGVSSGFITFSAEDTIVCVINVGVPYTARASFKVGACQENSVLSKYM